MKIVRRLHMYFGLALLPFLLLYGVTAILFNHPSLLSRAEVSRLEPMGIVPDTLTDAASIAESVFAALEHAIEADTDTDVELTTEGPADLVGDYVIDANSDHQRIRYRLTADGRRGTRTVTPIGSPSPSPFPARIDPPVGDASAMLTEAITSDADTDAVRVRAAPDVEFRVLVDGEPWIVLCDMVTGTVDARPAGDPRRAFDMRSFLLRLHVSRGYPLSVSARSLWAVVVDLTASLMIFWAISGLMMWWQMKPTRRAGAVVVAIGIVLSGLLGFAMLRLLYY
ncbi:MAG: PepSY domain-containing protein [Planctomycetota bacterium]